MILAVIFILIFIGYIVYNPENKSDVKTIKMINQQNNNRSHEYKEIISIKDIKNTKEKEEKNKTNKNILTKAEENYFSDTILIYNKKIELMKNIIKTRLGENCLFLKPGEINKKNKKITKLYNISQTLNIELELTPDEIHKRLETVNFQKITKYIDAKRNIGGKGKTFFLDKNNNPCSTEKIARDYYLDKGYKVIRAEVGLWQTLFCICFFEEIYSNNWDGVSDIPFDLFDNDRFFNVRKPIIEAKYKYILELKDLKMFINKQIEDFGWFQSRLLYPKSIADINYCKREDMQLFFSQVNIKDFALIIYNIAKNINNNRAGLPDYIVWNKNELKHIEVKREKEKLRKNQIDWISYFIENDIPVEILRVVTLKD